jgi:hypothetical protein
VQLESKLEDADRKEKKALFLGSIRSDSNAERGALLQELSRAISEYGKFVAGLAGPTFLTRIDSMLKQSYEILSLPAPSKKHLTSLRNWIGEYSCIARQEVDFLNQNEDLLNLAALDEEAVTSVGAFVEDCLMKVLRLVRSVSY